MAAEQFPTPTLAQPKPRSFGILRISFSHGSPSFPRGHADQGGRPWEGSAAALPRYVSPRLGGGDGGSRGGNGTGWPILESWSPGVNGGGAARVAVDGTLWAEPLVHQVREKMTSMAWAWARTRPHEHVPTVLEVVRSLFGTWVREEHLGMPSFAVIVRAAQRTVALAAPPATPAVVGRGGAGADAAAGESKRVYACKVCGETFNSGQVLGGHVTGRHRRARPSLASVPPANDISSFPPGSAVRKRPATEEEAAPGNGKRRCIRLFGADIAVEAPKE